MHTKQNSIENQLFLVNGIKCNLSVDRECMNLNPVDGVNREKLVRIVNFTQVIGFKRSPSEEFDPCFEAKENDVRQSKSEEFFRPLSRSPRRSLFDSKKGDKIKVYYYKQNGNKSSSQLLKVKKLIIEPISGANKSIKNTQQVIAESLKKFEPDNEVTSDDTSIDHHHHQQQQQQKKLQSDPLTIHTQINADQQLQESGPPSCYASEGSNSHLSSLSTSSRISQPANSISPSTSPSLTPIASPDEVSSPCTLPLDDLARQLEAALEPKRKQRPKHLLVFVNPFGGKGRALSLYKSLVHRLFEVAGIEAKLVVTKYANHARDTIEDPQFNVELFDGIVCVGGDGMFSELMNGLLYRYNRDLILTTEFKLKEENEGINGKGNTNSMAQYEATSKLLTDHRHSMNDCHSQTNDKADENNDCDNFSEKNNVVMPIDSKSNNNINKNGDELRLIQQQRQLRELRRALGGIGKPFVSPPIPVGVIGAGSTDANSFGLIGTNDVITAALNIILGNQIKIDVCSVHSIKEDRLLRFVSTFVAYGYFGDVIRESEKFRWLGPSRYDLTGANNLIKNRAYKGLVRILVSGKDGSPSDLNRCHANCELCCLSTEHSRTFINKPEPPCDVELSFIEKRGHFIGVNAAITACRCPQTKKGFSPNNHLANGCADLILVRPCTRIQYIQYLMRTGWTKKSAFDLKYVEAYRCRQFEFLSQHQELCHTNGSSTSSSSSSVSSTSTTGEHSSNYNSLDSKQSIRSLGDNMSSWNVDGEILNEQSVRVKVNNQLLRVFGTGEPQF